MYVKQTRLFVRRAKIPAASRLCYGGVKQLTRTYATDPKNNADKKLNTQQSRPENEYLQSEELEKQASERSRNISDQEKSVKERKDRIAEKIAVETEAKIYDYASKELKEELEIEEEEAEKDRLKNEERERKLREKKREDTKAREKKRKEEAGEAKDEEEEKEEERMEREDGFDDPRPRDPVKLARKLLEQEEYYKKKRQRLIDRKHKTISGTIDYLKFWNPTSYNEIVHAYLRGEAEAERIKPILERAQKYYATKFSMEAQKREVEEALRQVTGKPPKTFEEKVEDMKKLARMRPSSEIEVNPVSEEIQKKAHEKNERQRAEEEAYRKQYWPEGVDLKDEEQEKKEGEQEEKKEGEQEEKKEGEQKEKKRRRTRRKKRR